MAYLQQLTSQNSNPLTKIWGQSVISDFLPDCWTDIKVFIMSKWKEVVHIHHVKGHKTVHWCILQCPTNPMSWACGLPEFFGLASKKISPPNYQFSKRNVHLQIYARKLPTNCICTDKFDLFIIPYAFHSTTFIHYLCLHMLYLDIFFAHI